MEFSQRHNRLTKEMDPETTTLDNYVIVVNLRAVVVQQNNHLYQVMFLSTDRKFLEIASLVHL